MASDVERFRKLHSHEGGCYSDLVLADLEKAISHSWAPYMVPKKVRHQLKKRLVKTIVDFKYLHEPSFRLRYELAFGARNTRGMREIAKEDRITDMKEEREN